MKKRNYYVNSRMHALRLRMDTLRTVSVARLRRHGKPGYTPVTVT